MKLFWSFIALLLVATVVVFVTDASPAHERARSGPAGSAPVDRVPDQQRGDNPGNTAEDTLIDRAPTQPVDPLARRVRTDHEHRAASTDPDAPMDFMTFLFGEGAASGVVEVTEDLRAKDEASREAQITRLETGIEVDGRFTIRGKGSPDEPFELPWELLMSAREVYVPKDGREIIPGRVRMLHESWVAITGYVMLPTVRDKVDEFVIMQNQWDGCCLGIPPTPYDSVEVSLDEPVDFGFGSRQYATITGRMQVDPYLFGNGFLLGLYSIEDARMTVTEW